MKRSAFYSLCTLCSLCCLAAFGGCKKSSPATELPADSQSEATEAKDSAEQTDPQNLSPEEWELRLIKGVEPPTLPEGFAEVDAKAAQGDPDARERLIVAITSDFEHRSYFKERYDERAKQYLLENRDFKTPQILLQRALFELVRYSEAPDAGMSTAKPWLQKAFDTKNLEVLEYLAIHPELGFQAEALDILDTFSDPALVYRTARALEFTDDFMTDKRQKAYNDYLQRAADAGYLPAKTLLAIRKLDSKDIDTWRAGLEELRNAAQEGDSGANIELFNYLGLVAANNFDELQANGFEFPRDQYDALHALLGDDYAALFDAAARTTLPPDACTTLLQIGQREPSLTDKSKDAAILCYAKFVDFPDSTRCFMLNASLDPEPFDETQRAQLGKILLECHESALSRGDLYFDSELPRSTPSMATELSHLYAESKFVTPDPEKSLQYLVYAAAMDDVVAQIELSDLYKSGERIPKNDERACYWNNKAVQSETCQTYLNSPLYEAMNLNVLCHKAEVETHKCI